jgi:hypothetical protein
MKRCVRLCYRLSLVGGYPMVLLEIQSSMSSVNVLENAGFFTADWWVERMSRASMIEFSTQVNQFWLLI